MLVQLEKGFNIVQTRFTEINFTKSETIMNFLYGFKNYISILLAKPWDLM